MSLKRKQQLQREFRAMGLELVCRSRGFVVKFPDGTEIRTYTLTRARQVAVDYWA